MSTNTVHMALRTFSFFALLAVSLSASAQASIKTTISQLAPDNSSANGWYFVYPSSPITNGAACATDTSRFVLDPSTPKGQAMIATALTAWAIGATVFIVGTGDCSIANNVESLRYMIAELN